MGLLDSFMPGDYGSGQDGGYGSTPMNTGYNTGMQGLLSGNNPLFNIGMGILANNYGHYGAFGPAIGKGVQQGIQDTQTANQLAQRKKIFDLQMQEQQRKQAQEKAYGDAISKAFIPASTSPNMGFMDANNQAMQGQSAPVNPTDIANPQALPTAQPDYQWNQQAPASFDKQAMLNAVLSDPNIDGQQKFATFQAMQKDNTPIKLGKGESLLDPTTYKQLATAPNEPKYQIAPNGQVIDMNNPDTSKTYKDYSEQMLIPDGQGGFKINQQLLDAKKQIGKAGAPNISVNVANKTGEGLAKEVGPMIAASKSAAEGAIQQADIANRINSAIDSGKIITGPGTDARLKLLQIGNVLGVNGKDDNETLTNTRTAIQGLSQFTLSGRSALKGQGQISDYEGKLLAKATSGDLSDLTTPELKVITKAAQRVADAQYSQHQKNMKVMRSKPELRDVADFYDVGALPANQSSASTIQPPSGAINLLKLSPSKYRADFDAKYGAGAAAIVLGK